MKKKILHKILIIILLTPILSPSYSQATNYSQNSIYKKQILSYLDSGDIYQYSNFDSAIYFYTKAEQLAKKCNCSDLLAKVYNYKGIILINKGEFAEAHRILNQALKLSNDSSYIMYIQHNIASIYLNLKLYKQAYSIYRHEIYYFTRHKDTPALASALSNLAIIYYKEGLIDSAISYIDKSLQLYEFLKDTLQYTYTLMNKALYLKDKNDFQKAKKIIDLVREQAYKGNFNFFIQKANIIEGQLYEAKQILDSALYFYKQALSLDKKLRNLYSQYYDYLYISNVYNTLKNYSLAKNYLDSAQSIINAKANLFSPSDRQLFYHLGYLINKRLSQHEKALFFLEKEMALKDSLRKANQMQKLKIYQQQQAIKKTQAELVYYQKQTQTKTRLLRVYQYIGLFILFVLSIILYLGYKLHKARKQLLSKNQRLRTLLEKDKIQLTLFNILNKVFQSIDIADKQTLLQDILEEIIKIPWLNLLPQGAIYTTDNNGELVLNASVNFEKWKKQCSSIKPGECLCGQVLQTGKPIFKKHIDNEHSTTIEDVPDHGHFILPLKLGNKIIGIINLYTAPGVEITEEQKQFFDKLSFLIALLIDRVNQRIKIQENIKHQDALNQKLFAQSLMLEEQKRKVEQANKKIHQQASELKRILNNLEDSITYSSYLISSLLPSEQYLNSLFKEHFVIFIPRDKIGGDFYFASSHENKIIWGIGDATGHGVPGALIAFMGISLIQETADKFDEPKEALSFLRSKIKNLSHLSNLESVKSSGFELGLCIYDKDKKQLKYAGANITLYLLRNGQLHKFKGTKAQIGYNLVQREFSQYEINLQQNDVLILNSDGITDLLGGNSYKKLSRRNYEKILEEISTLPLTEQKKVLLNVITEWKGDNDQNDDIVIFGVKI